MRGEKVGGVGIDLLVKALGGQLGMVVCLTIHIKMVPII